MITEIVCPEFYIEEWEAAGRRFTDSDDPKVEFKRAADDLVCRLMRTRRDEYGVTIFVCRCGMQFKAADGKHVAVK